MRRRQIKYINLSAMTFMFAVGLGVVAMIRIGNQLGMKAYTDLKFAISLFYYWFV